MERLIYRTRCDPYPKSSPGCHTIKRRRPPCAALAWDAMSLDSRETHDCVLFRYL